MADNVTLNAGAGGAVIATDDDGVAQHQYVKIEFGADNTQTKVTSTVGLPVGDAGGSLTVDNAALSITGGGVEAAALRVTLASDSTGVVSVDDNGASLTVDNAALSVVGGGVEAAALRVTLASDSTGVVSVDDNGGSLTVDGTVTANLGATDTGNLAAIKTSVEILDNAISGAGFNITQLAGAAVPIGAGTEAAAVRVTLATDSTGVVSVDDNGASLTIDNAALSVTGGGVEAAALRVTLASDSTGLVSVDDNGGALTVDNAGTFAVQVSSALPAGTNAVGKLAANSGVDIGDVDVTSISAGANLIGDVGISGARTSGGTTLYRSIDLDETEEEVKATGGQIYWIHAVNLTATILFLKVYNATAANVTVGTTTPVLTFPVPSQGTTGGAGFVLVVPNGIVFSTAITIAATTGVADADTGAPAANACVVNLGYA